MIRLNKSTRFALYGLVELGQDPTKVHSAGQIASKYRISEHHVAKVLQQLARAGLVESLRGIKGGFRMQGDPAQITFLDVVEIFEPPTLIEGCMLLDRGERCEQPEACRIGCVIRDLQEGARESLKSISIASLLTREPC
jgi:Rrf2 family protein